jgi:hypothetical protein
MIELDPRRISLNEELLMHPIRKEVVDCRQHDGVYVEFRIAYDKISKSKALEVVSQNQQLVNYLTDSEIKTLFVEYLSQVKGLGKIVGNNSEADGQC